MIEWLETLLAYAKGEKKWDTSGPWVDEQNPLMPFQMGYWFDTQTIGPGMPPFTPDAIEPCGDLIELEKEVVIVNDAARRELREDWTEAVSADTARRLERERDLAIKERDEAVQLFTQELNKAVERIKSHGTSPKSRT